jgi:N-acetylmuramoyl-L-alanine amidase
VRKGEDNIMPKVILDPGHGGSDIGEYYDKRSEKNDNLQLALRIGQFLEDSDIEVAYTRTSDLYLPQLERTERANQIGGDLLVSLHRISGSSYVDKPSLDFFVKEEDSFGAAAAINIGNSIYDSGYSNYEVIVKTDIPFLSDTDMSAIIAEIGYTRSEKENRYFNENFVSIAEGIATGIESTRANKTRGND